MNPPRRISFSLVILISTLLCYIFSLAAKAEPGDFRQRAHQKAFTQNTEEDIQAEIEFGQTIAARLLGSFQVLKDPKLNRYVNLVGKSLAQNCSRPEIEFHFAILDIDKINAYSAPGGYVFITRGALNQMQDEAELAAVLAHEIAHITEKHIVNEFKIKGKDDSTISGVTRIIGASSDSARVAFFQAVDKAMEILLETGFKQKDEFGSDEVATLLLVRTGYDPTALKRYLERIMHASEKNATAKSTTHPATNERLEAMQGLLEKESLLDLSLPQGKKRFTGYVKQ